MTLKSIQNFVEVCPIRLDLQHDVMASSAVTMPTKGVPNTTILIKATVVSKGTLVTM